MACDLDLRGIMPALVTPFRAERWTSRVSRENGASLLEAGVSGVVCNGPTGEAVALTRAERKTLIDAKIFAPLVPTGMLFVPCRGGISHAPEEDTYWERAALGVEVRGSDPVAASFVTGWAGRQTKVSG